jgi:septal ring factor EnvC (AmiA/AmiB activator)
MPHQVTSRSLGYKVNVMETITSLSSRSLQYYAIARKWSSDVEFYKHEVKFLRSLLDDSFFNTKSAADRTKIAEFNNELMELDVEKSQLERLLEEQLKELELMAEDVIPEDANHIACKQIRLEYMVNDLFSDYKQLKREIFALVERVSGQTKAFNYFSIPN